MESPVKAVILAAGKGTRIQTEGTSLPKVMREALGRPLLSYVLEAVGFIPKEDIIIVAGYKKESVMSAFPEYSYALQEQQLGTGHAVMSAYEVLGDYTGQLLVCSGDMPLLKRETYEELVRVHREMENDCTILTGTSDSPLPYGRIVRDSRGCFKNIVEDKDCTAEQRLIDELNSSVYIFNAAALKRVLPELKNNNAQGEYYLTDAPGYMQNAGLKVGVCRRDLGDEIIGVNTVLQLNEVESLLGGR